MVIASRLARRLSRNLLVVIDRVSRASSIERSATHAVIGPSRRRPPYALREEGRCGVSFRPAARARSSSDERVRPALLGTSLARTKRRRSVVYEFDFVRAAEEQTLTRSVPEGSKPRVSSEVPWASFGASRARQASRVLSDAARSGSGGKLCAE